MKLLIGIPAFNEEDSISAVLQTLPKELDGIDSIDYLVIDDGSDDLTSKVASESGAQVVRHDQNRGVGEAFQTMVEQSLQSGSDVLLTIDADGQFDPMDIPKVLEPIKNQRADMVTGCRFTDSQRPEEMPWSRYWGNFAIALLLRLLVGTRLRDVSCGFRAYGREALLRLNLLGTFTYTQETILDLTFKNLRIETVPISVRYFRDRESRVAGSLLRYGINASKIIARTIRDFKPLRFFGTIGLAVFLLGFVMEAWLWTHYLATGSFTPYKVVGFAGGALNICGILLGGLGLLADMLYRIRANQERILYYHKKIAFGSAQSSAGEETANRQ